MQLRFDAEALTKVCVLLLKEVADMQGRQGGSVE